MNREYPEYLHSGDPAAGGVHFSSLKSASLIELIRPRHAAKSFVIIGPWLIAGTADAVVPTLLAVLSFCAMAMAVYAFNDALDANHDARHDKKCHRPIPSGRVTRLEAVCLSLVLFLLSLAIAYAVSLSACFIVTGYAILNFFYSLIGKRIPMIDVAIIAIGFDLRLYLGLLTTGLAESHVWLLGPVFLATLSLAVGKRFAKLGSANGPGDHKIPAFYTEGRTLWLLIAFSQVAIGVSTVIFWRNLGGLDIAATFSNFTYIAACVLGIAISTQVLVCILINRTEPTDIFTRDRFVVIATICAITIVTVDRFI